MFDEQLHYRMIQIDPSKYTGYDLSYEGSLEVTSWPGWWMVRGVCY